MSEQSSNNFDYFIQQAKGLGITFAPTPQTLSAMRGLGEAADNAAKSLSKMGATLKVCRNKLKRKSKANK